MIPEPSTEQPNLRRRLPLGATGFRDHRSEPLPETDPRTFTGVCHEAARRTGSRIGEITSPGTTPSFHLATISRGQDHLAILGHRHLPILAIADPPAQDTRPVIFVADPLLRDALTPATPFYLASPEELRTPLSLVDLSAMTAPELKQIAFWKPQTVGDLLFNYWD